jgi:hypothetical protein
MLKNWPPTFASFIALCLVGAVTGVAQKTESTAPGATAPETITETPPIRELGDERYQVGNIVVDKANHVFTLPGKVLHTESLLELDASATEFNLACILIGLTTDGVRLPRYQFDEEDVVGPTVVITVQWERDGESFDVPIAKLLYLSGKPVVSDRWRYTGSYHDAGPARQYMAELSGSLISFVHDPDSIIDHQFGVRIGAYGSTSGNIELLPELGMPLTVTVRHEPPRR